MLFTVVNAYIEIVTSKVLIKIFDSLHRSIECKTIAEYVDAMTSKKAKQIVYSSKIIYEFMLTLT